MALIDTDLLQPAILGIVEVIRGGAVAVDHAVRLAGGVETAVRGEGLFGVADLDQVSPLVLVVDRVAVRVGERGELPAPVVAVGNGRESIPLHGLDPTHGVVAEPGKTKSFCTVTLLALFFSNTLNKHI